jgi:hypothetical protein
MPNKTKSVDIDSLLSAAESAEMRVLQLLRGTPDRRTSYEIKVNGFSCYENGLHSNFTRIHQFDANNDLQKMITGKNHSQIATWQQKADNFIASAFQMKTTLEAMYKPLETLVGAKAAMTPDQQRRFDRLIDSYEQRSKYAIEAGNLGKKVKEDLKEAKTTITNMHNDAMRLAKEYPETRDMFKHGKK